MMSLSAGTSSSAASRGSRSLPKVVEGASTCVNSPATAASCGACTAASACALAGASKTSTRATPARLAAACGDRGRCRCPSTATAISPPMACAQRTRSRSGLGELATIMLGDDQHAVHQTSPLAASAATSSGTSLHALALLAHRRRRVVHAPCKRGCGVTPSAAGVDDVERLLLGLDDVRQLHETRFVQPQVHRDHGGQIDFQHFQARIDFAGDARGLAIEFDLRCEGGLRAIPQCRRASGRSGCCRRRWPACRAAPGRAARAPPASAGSARHPAARAGPRGSPAAARSAPIASAVRSWFCTSAGPMETTTTSSARPFSFRRRASSSAISSKGLMLCLTPSVMTPLLSAFTRMRTLKSTTRLMPTRMRFIAAKYTGFTGRLGRGWG